MISQDTLKTVISIVPDWEFETMTGYRWVKGEGGSHYWPGQWNLIPDWHKQIYLDALAAAAVRVVDGMPTKFHGDTQVLGPDMVINRGHTYIGTPDNVFRAEGPDRTANTLNAIAEFVRGGFDV